MSITVAWEMRTTPAYDPWPEITRPVPVAYTCPEHGTRPIYDRDAAATVALHLMHEHGVPGLASDNCVCGWRFERDEYADGPAYDNGNRGTHWPQHAAWIAEQHGVNVTPPEGVA